VVLAQGAIRSTADKAEAELTVAPALLARVAWAGRVLTGDALFCRHRVCDQVLAAGGDYLLVIKENQPTLYDDPRLLFDPRRDTPPPSRRSTVARCGPSKPATGTATTPAPWSPRPI